MTAHEEILESTDYPTFRKRLSAFDCRRCSLHEGRTHIVVDRGHPEAKMMVIGEGPGADEDRQGKAFVGRSGRLLDEMLREAGLDPEVDVLIANVVKCRPPANRAPKSPEVESCFPYLLRQIGLVRPRVLALLGATTVRHILPPHKKQPMKALVGRRFSSPIFPDREILVTFHPAFILRSASRRPEMVSHLRLFAEVLEETTTS